MSQKRQIVVRDFVNDVRFGMSDVQLMERHRLSAKGLNRAFEKLLEKGILSDAEVNEREQPYFDTVFFRNMRVLARHHLVVPLPIYEAGQYPNICGMVRDITENGIGVTGMRAAVDEIKSLCIHPDTFLQIEPISFRAQCRWTESETEGHFMAGFEIVEISQKNQQRLSALIQELTFG
jgi:hypothetical protein